MPTSSHKNRMLWLAGILHAFTHVYQVALVPLYLPIKADFKLASTAEATLLVTVLMLAYFLPSYWMGILADRFNRKKLLAWGLFINAAGFLGLAFAPNYAMAIVCVFISGLGGSFFHPAATAMIARLFPVGTGRALGLIGIGASVGFFAGPIYAGWRAAHTGNWRTPVLELGVLGVVAAGLFAWFADEEQRVPTATRKAAHAEKMFATPALWMLFVGAALFFSLRDFAGSSMGSLSSLFLQNARGYDVKETGLAVSAIFIASAVSNPLFGHLSDGGRKKWTCSVLLIAMVIIVIFPHVPAAWIIPTLLVYGFFFLANYPMVEAALMESVPDSVRGRVFGLFITIGGFVGNLSHWLVGYWVEGFGPAKKQVATYYPVYGLLAVFILISLGGLLCLHALRRKEVQVGELPSDAVTVPEPAAK